MSDDFAKSVSSWISSRASPATRTAYTRDLKLWLAHCKEEEADPSAPSRDVVVTFRDALQANYAPLTVRRVLATMSAAFATVLPGAPNPFTERALPRPPASEYSKTEAVTDEEARRIISAAGQRGEAPLRDVALLLVLWETGMRRVSAVSIRRDGVLRRGGTIRLRHVIKGGKEVESELPDAATAAIEAWLNVAPMSRWLFCVLDGSRALSPQAVTNIVAAASAEAGIHSHPHQFRSALITRALDAGIPLERVRDAVHHQDIRSTLRYDRGSRGAGVVGEVAAFRKKT